MRHQVKSLAYLDIGVDNGGIVLNISEIGLAVHAVSVLPSDPIVDIRLQLHKSTTRLETRAKVVWTSDTSKEAGIEFIDLPEDARLEIKEWLALENLEPLFIARGLRLESPPTVDPLLTRRTTRSDKWTNLVSELTSIPAGIDRVVESSRPSAYSGRATESTPLKEGATPVDLVSILAGEESDTHTPPKNSHLSASVVTDSKQSNLEHKFMAADPADLSVSPSPSANGNMPYCRSDVDFSLPSDKLLASTPHSGALHANRENETASTNGSRNHQEPDSSAAHGDDFLKKAHELFGTNGLARSDPEAAQYNSPILNLAGAAPAKLRSEDNSKGHGLAPTSSLIPTSALSGQTPIPNSWPVTSPRLNPDARLKELKHASTVSPERSLDLPSLAGLFALCVLLSVACLALGIVVGRSVATHSPEALGSSDNTPSLAEPADVQNNKVSHQPASSTTISRALKEKLPLDGASHRTAVADRPGDEDVISSQNGNNDPPVNAATDRSLVQSNSETSSPPNASSNGASITPLPAAPVSATAPAIYPTVPPNPNAAPRTQPPADRLVVAHLIYRVEPFYPKEALQQRVEGTVKIHATIGQDGRVKNLRVVSGPASLTSAALSAAQYWRYVPALRNGEPIESDEDISIEFHLLQ